MALSSEIPSRQKVADALAGALQKARTPLLIFIGVALAFVIAYSIYSQITTKREEKAAAAAESVQKVYSNWQSESDKKKKSALETKIVADTASILKTYPHTYAAQRALFIRGGMYFKNKDWKQSQKNYEQLADNFPKSYLAPVSLEGAAAASEEQGDTKHAIELDKKILNYKAGPAPEIPRALCAIGRLYEAQGDDKDAKTYYNKLINGYPSSGWTNLAQDRIIFLAAKASSGTVASGAGSTSGGVTPAKKP